MGLLLKLFMILVWISHGEVGIVTNFSATGDKWNPVPYAACLHRDLQDSDLVIANNDLPCRSEVFLYAPRTHRGVVVRVGDRGPRRAMADLAPAVTKALRANGMELVYMLPVSKALRRFRKSYQ